MASILFFVEQTDFTLKQKTLIRKWIQSTILKEKKKPGKINYIFCPDEYLLHINKTFLDHDTLTDIVTFPTEANDNPLTSKSKQNTINGEIYISIDRVKENAGNFNSELGQELRRVMIHGVLHLCGFGDKDPANAKKMRERENYYLDRFPNKKIS